MPKHTPQARITALINFVGWVGDRTEFVDRLQNVYIPCMPEPIRTIADRFYNGRDTRKTDPITGKPLREDSMFYQQVRQARQIIYALVQLESIWSMQR